MNRTWRSALWAFGILGLACGSAETQATVDKPKALPAAAIQLELRTAGGDIVEVSDYRGKPLLLFFFATFDGVSQAALRPTSRFARHHEGEVPVVGVGVQPNPRQLVDAFEQALTPPFPLTYDPNNVLTSDASPVGAIDAVPTFIMLDDKGVVRAKEVGFMSLNRLERMLFSIRQTTDPSKETQSPTTREASR